MNGAAVHVMTCDLTTTPKAAHHLVRRIGTSRPGGGWWFEAVETETSPSGIRVTFRVRATSLPQMALAIIAAHDAMVGS